MSMLSEQVKELRKMSQNYPVNIPIGLFEQTLREAADTIETLSAKLAKENMERSERYYNGGWIACSERLPTKEECRSYRREFLVTIDTKHAETLCMDFEYTSIRGKEVGRWIWRDRINIPWKILAWMPLPAPYKTD